MPKEPTEGWKLSEDELAQTWEQLRQSSVALEACAHSNVRNFVIAQTASSEIEALVEKLHKHRTALTIEEGERRQERLRQITPRKLEQLRMLSNQQITEEGYDPADITRLCVQADESK